MSEQTLNYITLIPNRDTSAADFVVSWSKVYKSSFYAENAKLYSENINREQHNEASLRALFGWKNGIKGDQFSKGKEVFLNSVVLDNIATINDLRVGFMMQKFVNQFKPDNSAFVWKIFLLHIVQPNQFPIFDQHVYRAVRYLQEGKIMELDANKNHAKMDYYQHHYLPAFEHLKQNSKAPLKQVDEALWAFGRFLKTNHTIVQP